MTTEWFTNYGSGVLVHEEDPTILLISGDEVPDYVKTPEETPEIGQQTFKVTGSVFKNCAKCGEPQRLHYILDGVFGVNRCRDCGFVWYKHR